MGDDVVRVRSHVGRAWGVDGRPIITIVEHELFPNELTALLKKPSLCQDTLHGGSQWSAGGREVICRVGSRVVNDPQ